MIVLGIESSCDETAAAVVRDGRHVLSSVIASQYDLHEEYAGVVPEIASRAHVEAIVPTIREALSEAGLGLGMIDAVAVGNRPGLIGSLLIGVATAKSLAWSLGKPLIGVDHVQSHLYSGLLIEPSETGAESIALRDPSTLFPALGLVVSGGHTSLYRISSFTDLKRLGATIDDAIGEAFDKAATILTLPHPGGPNLDRLARSPGANDRAFDFPISRLGTESLDFSFSGLKTSLLYQVRGVPNARDAALAVAPPLTPDRQRDLAASFQRAAIASIILKLNRAYASFSNTPPRALFVGGGVSANSRLRTDLQAWSADHGLPLFIPPMRYCMDNAAMIAGLGTVLLQAGQSSDLTLEAVPTTAV